MNIRRLKMAHRALVQFAANPGNLGFHLNTWVNGPAIFEPYLQTSDIMRKALKGDNYCGTTACAMGLFCILPEFNEEGLLFTPTKAAPFIDEPDRDDYNRPRRHYGFEAAEYFFGLNCEDATEIFAEHSYDGDERQNPLAVADKIYALIQVGEAEAEAMRGEIDRMPAPGDPA